MAGSSSSLASQKLYDYVIPVEPIYSRTADNLRLMKRLDLSAALTKIHLWNQTQFRKVVYVDADMVAMRPPDELFDLDQPFAASPDVGWPDCFNSVPPTLFSFLASFFFPFFFLLLFSTLGSLP